MNFRTTFILLAALILVAGYFVFEDAPAAEEANAIGVDAPWFYTASMEDIQHIAVQAGGAEAAFTSEGPGAWFFDEPHRPPVDLARWGGITLLLGGPQTQRVIAESLEDPAAFGLRRPRGHYRRRPQGRPEPQDPTRRYHAERGLLLRSAGNGSPALSG